MYSQPGRPREFTHKKREELINHIAQGASVEEAAQIVGVTLRTVQRAAKHKEFFHHDLQLALHSAPPDPHVLMQRAARTHWRAAAWLLERTDPDKFAKRPPNSCSPETLRDVSDWLIEKALEATAPEHRACVYRHMRAAGDKALDMLMPDIHIARRGMTAALAVQPTPLSSQEFVKTIPVLPERDASRPSLLEIAPPSSETAPPSSGPGTKLTGPPPVPRWFPRNGFTRQDSDAMDSAEHHLTPEEEEAWANAADATAQFIAARDALHGKTEAAARKKSESDKSRRDQRNESPRFKFTPPTSRPSVDKAASHGVETPPVEKPVENLVEKPVKPAAAGAAPPAPRDGGIMSPKMSAATEPDATHVGGTAVSPSCEGDPAPPDQHAFSTLLARFRAIRHEAPLQRAA